jgi:hypothetical protein
MSGESVGVASLGHVLHSLNTSKFPYQYHQNCFHKSTEVQVTLCLLTGMFEGDPFVGWSLSGRIDGGEDDVVPVVLGQRLGPFAAAPEPRRSTPHRRRAGSDAGRHRVQRHLQGETSRI